MPPLLALLGAGGAAGAAGATAAGAAPAAAGLGAAAGPAAAAAPALAGAAASPGIMGAVKGMMGSILSGPKALGSGFMGRAAEVMPAGVMGPPAPASGLMGTLGQGGIPTGLFSNLGSMQGLGNALGSLAGNSLLGNRGGARYSAPPILGGQVYGTPTQGMSQDEVLAMILQSILR
jgi:hypothetical protein